MSARNGPHDDDRRPHEGERRIGERLGGRDQNTTSNRQLVTGRAAAGGEHVTAPEIACLEAEAAYLGCLLRMPRGWAQIALTSVSDDDFADPRHRVVLSGIRHTINRGFDPDPVAVLGELRRLGLLPSFLDDKSAGVVLAEVHAAPPLPDNASFYFRIVAEHAFRRRVAEAAARLEQVAGTESLDGLTEVLRDEWDALRIHWERTMRYDVPPSEVDE